MSDKGTKSFFSLFKNTDDEYEEEYDSQEEYDLDSDITPLPKYQSSNKVVNLGQGEMANAQIKVMIFEPASYDEDAPAIVDSLKENKVCIVNLGEMKDKEAALRIFNFLKGAIYAMGGRMRKISSGILLLAPDNTDIDGNIKKELETKGFFKWQ
ncbi:MAG: cell division protein SepF [Peptostreptococcaceae bacterium]|nr:cell division protein SepF [Peptostreptococcaceae bacterium]